jgi:hypothetical protein
MVDLWGEMGVRPIKRNKLEGFCADINQRPENLSNQGKRQITDILDVRGKLAIENDEKVIYIKCILLREGQQQSPALTLPLSSIGGIASQRRESLPMARFR